MHVEEPGDYFIFVSVFGLVCTVFAAEALVSPPFPFVTEHRSLKLSFL